ncbi:phage tail tape measure protein [Brevibacterium luteolum]|uniref:Phage tail tape measure protein n=1 Tax=Brevibacterium luteolum TaxID=199591 RepID=A0A2N6PIJ5_9MICO|nr:phage tail tape measure protein [Brevibacterium luteolum]PMB98508.1 phage tail tape measure protein [Brevibacterium luteolum]
MADRTVAYRMFLDATGVATGAKVARNALQGIHRDGIAPVQKHLTALERSARAHPEAWQHAGRAATIFGAGVAVSLGMATKAAMSWQSDWAGVTKTVEGTTAQMDGLQQGLRDLAATTLPATHTEIAGVAEAAGQLGIKTQNVLQFTKTIIDLGEATNLTAEQGGTQLARFMNIMGTSQSKVNNLGSAVVGLGNNFATTESEIMDMSMRIASAGRQAGMTEGDVLGLATALSSVGIEAEAGGTAASMVIKKMGLEVDRGGDKLDLFAKTAGMSTTDFAKAFKGDAAGALATFVEGLGKAQAEGENVNVTLSELGIKGIRESNAILSLAAASDVMKNALATGNTEYIKASALAEEASQRYETAESRAKIALNSIKDASIDFGQAVLPAFAAGADAVTGLMTRIRELPQPLKEATVGFAGIAGTASLAAGGFLTIAPKVFDVVDGFKTLNATHPRLAGGLTTLGKAAGLATVGLLTARGAAAALNSVIDTSSRSTSEMTSAIAELQNKASGDVKNTVLDPELWEEANSFWNRGIGTKEIEDWGDALDRVNMAGAGMQQWLDGVAGTRSDVTIIGETIASTDEALRDLASGGAMESAADGFTAIRDSAEGMTDSEVLEQFPKYKDYLREIAGAAGLATDDAVLLAIATGRITEEMLEANPTTAEGVDKLADLGVEAKTTEEKIADLADEIRTFGQATLDTRAASREYEQSLDDAREALEKNGKTLDDTTQKGRDNAEALDRIARAGADRAASIYEETQSEEELQKALDQSREDLIKTARSFGMSEDAAKDYADRVLMTPDEVKTEVKVQKEQAKKDLDSIVKDLKDTDGESATLWVRIKKWFQGEADGSNAKERRARAGRDGAGVGGRAYGGIDVKAMAAGGTLDPIAQVVPPNTWRIVGDRLDVPEAFIPIDGSRRSWKILTETISRMPGALPMASGAVVSGSKDDEQRRKAEQERKRREDEAKRRREEAAARRARVADMRRELRTDLRRGDLRDQTTRGLSGAYSTVDRMLSLSRNEDLSRGTRARLARDASGYESSLRRLYGQLEKLEKRAENAQKKLDELKQIQDSVASSIGRSAYSLDVTSQWSQTRAGVWEQTQGVSGVRKNAAQAAARVRDLSGKLNRLQKMGYSGAILQEVAQAGSIDESLQMADELLKGTSSDVKSINRSYADIDKHARQAGKYVTHGFYKGGVDAATGLVKGLESQQKQVEKTILKIAKSMESSLKRALGIRSPSKKTEWIGEQTAEGFIGGILGKLDTIRAAAEMMGAAAIPQITTTPSTARDASDTALTAPPALASAADSVPAGASGEVPGVDELAALTSEAYAGMDATAKESLVFRQEITASSYQGMQDSTASALASMRSTQLAEHEAMTADQQATMQLLTRISADGFTRIDRQGREKTHELHKGVGRSMRDLRSDYGEQLGQTRRSSHEGFETIRRAGVSSIAGMRAGVRDELGKMPGHVASTMNRSISVLNDFRREVNDAFGDVGVKLPAVKRVEGYAGGGVIPGYSTHLQGDDQLIKARAGEGIYVSEAMRDPYERKRLETVNKAALRGENLEKFRDLPFEAFATGGIVKNTQGLIRLGHVLRSIGVRVSEGPPPFGPIHRVHARNSWHYRNGALDLNTAPGKSAKEMRDFDRIMPILHALGWGVIWRYPNHYGHAHVDIGNRSLGSFNRNVKPSGDLWEKLKGLRVGPPQGGGEGGTYGMSHPLLDRAGMSPSGNLERDYEKAARKIMTGIVKKHAGRLSDNEFASDLIGGIMRTAETGIVAKAKAHGKEMGTYTDPGGAGVERWRDTIIKALQIAGLPTSDDYVNAWLRQVKTESNGNHRAIQQVRDINSGGNEAAGLLQVIPSTFAAFRDRSLPNDRFHPLANAVAGMNWAKFKASRLGRSMLSFIGRGHGYAEGTDSALPGWKWVGEEGPELMRFKGGEQVIPSKVSHQIENQVLRGGNVSIEQSSVDSLKAALVTQITEADMAAALDGVQLTLMVDGRQMAAHITATVEGGIRTARSNNRTGSRLTGATL